MFDLEKAIAAWRHQFTYRRLFLREDVDELERHVRDQVRDLMRRGMAEEAAFREALHAMGDFAGAEEEYQKVYWGKLKQKRRRLNEIMWRLTMLANYLKVALRNLRKYKFYAFINVAGLAIGLACCFLILLYVQDERSYDRYHEKADTIYRVIIERPNRPLRARSEYLLAPTLQAEFPFVEQGVRLSRPGTHFVTREDQAFTETNVFYADSTVFDLFSFPLLRGDPETALADPNALVITASMARKYFGEDDPLGQTLLFDQRREMVITAVAADVPTNSHFRFDFLAPMSVFRANWGAGLEEWRNAEIYTYLQIPDAEARATLEATFPSFIDRHLGPDASANQAYHLQPLTDIHLHSVGVGWEIVPQGDIRYVYTFSTIALLILLIACINFINLATARAAKRSKEVGLRKVVGAQRGQLIQQFLSESLLISFVALLLGVVLIALALPTLNALTGKSFTLGDMLAHSLSLLALALVVGLLSGSYPAFALSRFRPVVVLKGRLQGQTKGISIRNVLVVFQFTITAVLIFGSLIAYQQLDYMQNKDLGFEQAETVVVRVPGSQIGTYPTYKAALSGLPGVQAVTASSHVPPATWGYPGLTPHGSDSTVAMKLFAVDFGFIEMLGLEMATGRGFDQAFATDSAEALILNETAVRQLGWTNTNALGQRARLNWVNKEGTVVGVVKDFHFRSLRQQIQPAVFTIAPRFYWNVVVKIDPAQTAEALAALDEAWQAVVPGFPFTYSFLDAQIGAQYRADAQLGQLIGALTLLSIVLACLGLLGLAAFMTEQRTKEIGVRKVLGASVTAIVSLLSKDVVRLILLAFVLAAPLAYLAANQWLKDFAYRIDIGLTPFLLTATLVLLLGLLTVGYQTLRAAMADPVQTLRYE